MLLRTPSPRLPAHSLLVILSVPPILQRHAAVACVRGSGWAELNEALQSEDFMSVIDAAGLNRRHNPPKAQPQARTPDTQPGPWTARCSPLRCADCQPMTTTRQS